MKMLLDDSIDMVSKWSSQFENLYSCHNVFSIYVFGEKFCLLTLNPANKCFRFSFSSTPGENERKLSHTLFLKFLSFLRKLNLEEPEHTRQLSWTIAYKFDAEYQEDLQTDNFVDSGIHIITKMFFIVNDCPIYFRVEDLLNMRYIFAYWLLSEHIPDRA